MTGKTKRNRDGDPIYLYRVGKAGARGVKTWAAGGQEAILQVANHGPRGQRRWWFVEWESLSPGDPKDIATAGMEWARAFIRGRDGSLQTVFAVREDAAS